MVVERMQPEARRVADLTVDSLLKESVLPRGGDDPRVVWMVIRWLGADADLLPAIAGVLLIIVVPDYLALTDPIWRSSKGSNLAWRDGVLCSSWRRRPWPSGGVHITYVGSKSDYPIPYRNGDFYSVLQLKATRWKLIKDSMEPTTTSTSNPSTGTSP